MPGGPGSLRRAELDLVSSDAQDLSVLRRHNGRRAICAAADVPLYPDNGVLRVGQYCGGWSM